MNGQSHDSFHRSRSPGTTQQHVRANAIDKLQQNHHSNIEPEVFVDASDTEAGYHFLTRKRASSGKATCSHRSVIGAARNVATFVFVDTVCTIQNDTWAC